MRRISLQEKLNPNGYTLSMIICPNTILNVVYKDMMKKFVGLNTQNYMSNKRKEKKEEEEKYKQESQTKKSDNAIKERNNNHQWITRKNKYKRDRFGHILGEVNEITEKEVQTSNAFKALKGEEENQQNNKNVEGNINVDHQKEGTKMSTKELVNTSFEKGIENDQEVSISAEKGAEQQNQNNRADNRKDKEPQRGDQQEQNEKNNQNAIKKEKIAHLNICRCRFLMKK
ncbi:GRIP and coiled-coil domain-containing protein-like [Capsicum annuum]|uniref:GRIP and coiled-coil domain-containing protein-like n=1 Tax=Capsicum annuum TaxID=4072 RepID=UPI001FB0A8EC|nr:GRIP and coiled-coil domain-containing protein-like [Capsicum annuum]